MNAKQTVRFVSTAAVLCSGLYLIVDVGFSLLAPSARGTWEYVVVQALADGLLWGLIASRKIVIFVGEKRENEEEIRHKETEHPFPCSHR